MYRIFERIKIIKPVVVSKSYFTNNEIIPSAMTTAVCCDCNCENKIEIIPYQTGFPIFQVYNEDQVLSKDELLENKIITDTSQGMKHVGELTVQDLPTLYFGIDCQTCSTKYFCVFGYGEKQSGLIVLVISGVWKYEFVL